jgi:hypothetical protein
MCYGRGLLSTQVGQSVHPPNPNKGIMNIKAFTNMQAQARPIAHGGHRDL